MMASGDDWKGFSSTTPSETQMTQDKFNDALQCLVDNGIDVDEADIVLQALCYIILDEETEQFFSSDEDWVKCWKTDRMILTTCSLWHGSKGGK